VTGIADADREQGTRERRRMEGGTQGEKEEGVVADQVACLGIGVYEESKRRKHEESKRQNTWHEPAARSCEGSGA
jgi:hypothetical protein